LPHYQKKNLLLDAESTKRATKSALKVFHQYLEEKKADEPQKKYKLANTLNWSTQKFKKRIALLMLGAN